MKSRMFGFFIAPVTGLYTFYISIDDNAEVYLSTDSNPLNAAKILGFTRGQILKEL